MNKNLQQIFDRLEEQRSVVLNQVRTMTPDQLNAHPPGKWSAQQILAHLIAAERLSLSYMKKKILGIREVGNSGWWEEMKMVVLKISQRLPGIKFKAPRTVVENTPTYASFAELEKDWNHLRQELATFLEQIPDDHARRKIYRHVIAGRLGVQHALQFFREHIHHHHPQIKSLLKK